MKRIQKVMLLVLALLLITTSAHATASSQLLDIPGLIADVTFGMDHTSAANAVKAIHADASVYSDGVSFNDSIWGFDDTTVMYLWPKGGVVNQIGCNFTYGEDGPMFSDIEAILLEMYGEPIARMSDRNLFAPKGDYAWDIDLSGRVRSSTTSSGRVDTATNNAIEYLFVYNDTGILLTVTNIEMTVFMNFMGSVMNIGGDDYVTICYTVLTPEDFEAALAAGMTFSSVKTSTQGTEAEASDAQDAITTITEGDFTYKIAGGEATITAYTGTAKTVKVNSEVNGVKITAIDGFGKGYDELSNIILPETISSVQVKAFSAFKNVTFTVDSKNEYLASIDGNLFDKKAKSLLFGKSGILSIPSGIKSISADACRARTFTSIVIPDSVIEIGDRAFEKAHFSSISFGTGLQKIGTDAFNNASLGRAALKLPDSLVTIGDRAFRNFGAVSEISFGSNIEFIGEEAFAGLDIMGTYLQYYPCSHSRCHDDYSKTFSIVLPASLRHLGKRAFADIHWVHDEGHGGYCSVTGKFSPSDGQFRYYYYSGTLTITLNTASLDGIIEDGVFDQSNGRYAGWNMHKNLADPSFYVNVTLTGNSCPLVIGANAFKEVDTVTLGTNAQIAGLGASAFEKSYIKDTPSFSDEFTVLNEAVFNECRNFTLSEIPASVTRIESKALSCSSIKQLELGSQIEFIAPDAFDDNVVFSVYSNTYAETWAIENSQQYEYVGGAVDDYSWLND